MPKDSSSSLVKRLITFLKRSDALAYEEREPAHNPYDDYAAAPPPAHSEPTPPRNDTYPAEPELLHSRHDGVPVGASRLDALIMRAVQQFNAQVGYVISHAQDGRLTYITGRDAQGRYIKHGEVDIDRRAVFLALDSGESQLFVQTGARDMPVAVLCGPLWGNNEVIGVLYLDNPARSRLHRGVFDVFCDQAARMLAEGVM